MSVFTKRLKEARTRAGLSQERLGVMAHIDEMSSSARMNQYERGKHEPDFSMVERIAHPETTRTRALNEKFRRRDPVAVFISLPVEIAIPVGDQCE